MTLIDEIKRDQLIARKSKNGVAATLLTTLIGEATQIGKNKGNRESTDSEVVSVVQKFVKNINETITALSAPNHKHTPESLDSNRMKISVLDTEKEILAAYLPKQLTKDQMVATINQLIAEGVIAREMKSKGLVMKHFKDNFTGQYDGSVLAISVDESLKASA
jgi:uncharacterized protein YqeY